MKKFLPNHISFAAVCAALLAALSLAGEVPDQANDRDSNRSSALRDEIERADAALFDAFNSRDLETMKQLFTKDLEFFHDKGGLSSYEQNIESLKQLFESNKGLRRELVEGSLEVYPIKGYGAIQIGTHEFCNPEDGTQGCGTFKFVHIWKRDNGAWKVARVISYGH